MVRIVVEDDVVAVPEPAVDIVVVIRGDGEPEAAEAEAVAASPLQPVDVLRADDAREVPVLPGMIEVVVRVAAAGVVPHPLIALGMHVRGVGMPGRLGVVGASAALRCGGPSGCAGRRGAVSRDVTAADLGPAAVGRGGATLAAATMLLALLRQQRERTAQQHRQ